jgi:hypothetical protein
VYHHYVLNDDLVKDYFVVDENVVVVVEINDLKVMDDDQQDDLNTMNVLGVFVVENVLVEVVVVEDDDDETYDEMNDQDDEAKQEVSIVKL